MTHSFDLLVNYEDTDMGGIVYHANYLRYIERARSDWVRALGVDQMKMRDEGVVFAVRKVDSDYLAPTRFEDALTIETQVVEVSGARLTLDQVVLRDGRAVFTAQVVIVAIDLSGRPTRLPAEIRALAG
ncbi:MAG: tol-pal system-associated acyl-CoA thioesterase [Rhodobacteraceae bacterium]|nr:tol-pal system-associated acyl-CoA thioesterase [Paracoccaceae bacterium]MAY43887.1 tol-pal system-associated acyl-CoA thioesterase [Paracoccaceae bacterium]QEW21825.1 Acyl-CoA thioester hydrolase YbgC [Marinibacterium anthonyi]